MRNVKYSTAYSASDHEVRMKIKLTVFKILNEGFIENFSTDLKHLAAIFKVF